MTDIVITGSRAFIDGKVRQPGERVSVPEHTAQAFVRTGRASMVAEKPPIALPAEPIAARVPTVSAETPKKRK